MANSAQNRRDNEFLNELQQGFGIRDDKDLAVRLGIPLSTFKKIRGGESNLTWKQRFVVADKIGFLTVREGLEAITPDSIARRIRLFTNQACDDIIQNRRARLPENHDELLARFILRDPNLSSNSLFRSKLGESLDNLYQAETEGLSLSSDDRARIISSLGYLHNDCWTIEQKDFHSLAKSSKALYEKLLTSVYPIDPDELDESALIDSFKQLVGITTDSEYGRITELSKQQIRQIRNGKASLPIKARLLMAIELDNRTEGVHAGDIDKVEATVGSTESMYERWRAMQKTPQ